MRNRLICACIICTLSYVRFAPEKKVLSTSFFDAVEGSVHFKLSSLRSFAFHWLLKSFIQTIWIDVIFSTFWLWKAIIGGGEECSTHIPGKHALFPEHSVPRKQHTHCGSQTAHTDPPILFSFERKWRTKNAHLFIFTQQRNAAHSMKAAVVEVVETLWPPCSSWHKSLKNRSNVAHLAMWNNHRTHLVGESTWSGLLKNWGNEILIHYRTLRCRSVLGGKYLRTNSNLKFHQMSRELIKVHSRSTAIHFTRFILPPQSWQWDGSVSMITLYFLKWNLKQDQSFMKLKRVHSWTVHRSNRFPFHLRLK
jgi:hypothetical protein